ncbi:MAG: hypothetical protein ACK5QX_02035 [bacterium]
MPLGHFFHQFPSVRRTRIGVSSARRQSFEAARLYGLRHLA